MKLSFKNCYRFSSCSVNNCPLNHDYPHGFVHEDDPEQECTCPKKDRMKIAEKFPSMLKYGGMTVREYNTKEILEAISEEK